MIGFHVYTFILFYFIFIKKCFRKFNQVDEEERFFFINFTSLFSWNFLKNSSLESGLWYSFNLWPFTRKVTSSSSIVLIFTAPLSKIRTISYGPSQCVWNLPWKSLNFESNKRAQSPSLNFFSLMYLSCHLALCCWTRLVFWTAFVWSHPIH